MKVICDTNVFIKLFTGDEEVMTELLKIGSENVIISSISLMELYGGMQNKRELTAMINKLRFYNIVHINSKSSEKAVELIRDFKLSYGLQIPDALIGAMAISYNLPLYTYNLKDFKFMPNLQLYLPS